MNGSRTARPSHRHAFVPLLVLFTTAVILGIIATSALAWEKPVNWEHGGATENTCDVSGCHGEDPSTNAACLRSGCHATFKTSGGEKCWECHRPGQDMTASKTAAGCTATCHLEQRDRNSYPTTFSHGATPHLGASGYGKTCTACHSVSVSSSSPGGSPHHDVAAGHQPTCAECHNGTLAKVPPGHEGRTNCTTCHNGMNRPSGDCASCHVGNPGTGSPQISYSNDLACGDAACHGKVANHSGTPISAAPCITCHTEHYATLGACTKCHSDPQSFHHATAKATPLADCAGCHNGSIAAVPPNHQSYGTNCASCHTGMNKPPSDCMGCHDKAQGGVPAVVYTNDLTCGDARCHSMVPNHSGTPIKNVACTTCHVSHYESLGTCVTCHADPRTFHHGTARATPLTDCATCHDGKTATAKEAHAGMSCASCHDDMTRPPVPATCQTCHEKARFGDVQCTMCHSAAGWIGKETVHETDPAATVACTTCHKKHYADLGACDTCHGSHAETHHSTATLADTQLTLKARPTKVKPRAKARLGGSLKAQGVALAGQKVLIQRSTKGSKFRRVGVVTTSAKGSFSRTVKPRATTVYRAVWRPVGDYVLQQRPALVTIRIKVRK